MNIDQAKQFKKHLETVFTSLLFGIGTENAGNYPIVINARTMPDSLSIDSLREDIQSFAKSQDIEVTAEDFKFKISGKISERAGLDMCAMPGR